MATPSWSAQRSGSAGWLRQDDSSRPAPASGLVAASAGGGAGCSRATINHLVAGQQRVPKIAIAVDLSRVLELNGAEYDRFDGRGGAGVGRRRGGPATGCSRRTAHSVLMAGLGRNEDIGDDTASKAATGRSPGCMACDPHRVSHPH